MPSFKSISFKMAVLQGGGQNLPPPPCVCVIQKTPCGIGLKHKRIVFKGPVKLIQQVKIAHSFLQSVSTLFHFIILDLPVYFTYGC